jgi:hypothetical protein
MEVIVVGYFLVFHLGEFNFHSVADVASLGVGSLLFSVFSARHFGEFHGGNSPQGH